MPNSSVRSDLSPVRQQSEPRIRAQISGDFLRFGLINSQLAGQQSWIVLFEPLPDLLPAQGCWGRRWRLGQRAAREHRKDRSVLPEMFVHDCSDSAIRRGPLAGAAANKEKFGDKGTWFH